MSKTTFGARDWRELPGMAEARRLLGARTGSPTEADRPQRSRRGRRQLPGQLAFPEIDGSGRLREEAED